MTDNQDEKHALERLQALQEKRRHILSLEPKEAMARILDDPQSMALVHSFPEQDFYFLIHDIGPQEALPLLSLASNRQWEHVIDLEAWQKDSINLKSVSRWFELLLEADSTRFIRWFLEEKLELGEFYLFKSIEVRIREHDQDPSEFGEDFFSLDNTYFIRFIDKLADTEETDLDEEQRKKFISRLAQKLAEFDHRMFQGVLLEATHLIPAESEEACYRWRRARLAEKGFLPFDEAIGIYQPIKPQDLMEERTKSMPHSADTAFPLPVPQYPAKMLQEDNHFTRAMAAIETQNALSSIQIEFANLCNQIIVADHKTIRDREELRDIVKKAAGYINIGLERLSGDETKLDPQRTAALISRYPLLKIFKVGFGGALTLKWRTEKWLDQCWFAQAGLRLTFWGEQWLGVLGGLLLKKPLFYDNYKTGVLYREFTCLEDLMEMEDVFNQVKRVDELLSLMSIQMKPPTSYGFLTYKNLLLTLWTANYLKLPVQKLQPISLEEFKPFYEELLRDESGDADGGPRRVPQTMKNLFLQWLSTETGLKDFEINEHLGNTLETLFREIENELGRVAYENLDPRFVQLFLLAGKN